MYRGYCPLISKVEPIECWGAQCQLWDGEDCCFKKENIIYPFKSSPPPTPTTPPPSKKDNIYKGTPPPPYYPPAPTKKGNEKNKTEELKHIYNETA